MKIALQSSLFCLLVAASLLGNAKDPDLEHFQGHWEVVELVEDGHVIPHDAVEEWLPSGGRFDIVENSMIFTSHEDGKKHARVFEIDATQNPKGIDLLTREKIEAVGIYRFDGEKLVVCLNADEDGSRPTDFSARKGSKRMLMVLKKTSKSAPRGNHSGPDTPKALTDEDVAKRLPGSWRHRDDLGALVITLRGNGTWSTIRETQELRLLKKVFVRTPISSGTWTLKNGTLNMLCKSSVYPDRINRTLPFTIRSVTENEMTFIDYYGLLSKAVRIE